MQIERAFHTPGNTNAKDSIPLQLGKILIIRMKKKNHSSMQAKTIV